MITVKICFFQLIVTFYLDRNVLNRISTAVAAVFSPAITSFSNWGSLSFTSGWWKKL